MEKDGSVLKYMYSVEGGGLGLIAAGLVLLAFDVMLSAALWMVMEPGSILCIGLGIGIPSVLMIIGGVFLQKRKVSGWLKAYAKGSGLSEEEIRSADAEFHEPGTVLFSLEKGKDSNSLKKMGFITAHYIRFPGISPCLYRISNLTACFYTKSLPFREDGHDHALVAYGMDENRVYTAISYNEKAGQEIVEAVEARNPLVITAHRFAYEGKKYDAVQGVGDVIRLQKQIRGI